MASPVPTRADPGLVYDLSVPEYAAYLCALLGDRAQATIVRNASLSCSKLPETAEAQLNYPTITVPLQPTPFTVNRTVTNVGPAASTYTAKVDVPGSLKVQVSPATLVFSKAGEKKTFSVSVSGQATGGHDVVQGSLSWAGCLGNLWCVARSSPSLASTDSNFALVNSVCTESTMYVIITTCACHVERFQQ